MMSGRWEVRESEWEKKESPRHLLPLNNHNLIAIQQFLSHEILGEGPFDPSSLANSQGVQTVVSPNFLSSRRDHRTRRGSDV